MHSTSGEVERGKGKVIKKKRLKSITILHIRWIRVVFDVANSDICYDFF